MSFAGIYRRYHQDLYRYCLTIVGNPDDAQDALQNTMIKAMRALPGERRRIKLKPWLYRIAHNESIDLLRKRRAVDQIDPELAAGGPSAAETAELRERLGQLIADLGELPDRQRGALVMRELGGLSFEQIAAVFETSPAVARQTVYEARLSLRQMDEGREMSCEEAMRALSDADGRIVRRRDIRAHLRACPSCREFRDAIDARRHDFVALAPLPAVVSAGLLQGILGSGSSGAGTGAGLAGSVGTGAGKAVATSAVAKSAATVAVAAAVGAGAADRSGLIHVIPRGGGGDRAERVAPLPEALTRSLESHRSASPAPKGNTPRKDGESGRRGAVDAHRTSPSQGDGSHNPPGKTLNAAGTPAVTPDKHAQKPLHGQKPSNWRNDEIANQGHGGHGSPGSVPGRGAGSAGGAAKQHPPRQPGNSAQTQQPTTGPPPGAGVHTGEPGRPNAGPESGLAGEGKGLRPLLPR